MDTRGQKPRWVKTKVGHWQKDTHGPKITWIRDLGLSCLASSSLSPPCFSTFWCCLGNQKASNARAASYHHCDLWNAPNWQKKALVCFCTQGPGVATVQPTCRDNLLEVTCLGCRLGYARRLQWHTFSCCPVSGLGEEDLDRHCWVLLQQQKQWNQSAPGWLHLDRWMRFKRDPGPPLKSMMMLSSWG